MAKPDRERDLLLCLTAIEEKVASVESLAGVLRKWLDEPTSSLDHLLVEQGVITIGQMELLESRMQIKLALPDVHPTNTWKTLPPPIQITLTAPSTPQSGSPDSVERTFDNTSARPAPILGGKNDERFNIVSRYAEGGLGEVSVAHDQQLGRMVALKQIKTRWADDVDARSRFLQEAQITGRLEHPGIVPVYALGFDASGRPYYAMRFIEGETLQEIVKRFHSKYHSSNKKNGDRMLGLRKLLGRLVDVCNAMDYAHNRGIIHRDLKPANIMLGKYGETLVVDWGLAKVVGHDKLPPLPFHEITATGSSGVAGTVMGTALGTPAYMSPEQAAGKNDELGPQTDIYSLGVTLFHVLTGRLPYEEDSVSGVLQKIQSTFVASPRIHSAWLPRPLEAICLKSMATRAEDRYPSTAALADDIERWLADEPVAAHDATFFERSSRWLRHHRTFVMSFFVANVLATVGITAGMLMWNHMRAEEYRHKIELEQQDRERLAERKSSADSSVKSADAEMLAGRFVAARDYLQSAVTTLKEDEQLAPDRTEVERRLKSAEKIVNYYHLAELGEEMSVAQRDTEAQTLMQQALGSLGVFQNADWWAHLPAEDLTAEQTDALRQDIYLKLNLLIAHYSKSMHLHVASRKGENDARRVLIFNDLIQRYRPAEFARWYAAFSRFRLRRGPTIDVSQLGEPLNAADAFAKGVMYAVGADYDKLTGAFASEKEDLRLLAKRHLELAAQMNPNHYWTHYMLGYVELARAEHESDHTLGEYAALFASARRAFAQCISLRPDNWRAYAERVLCYQREIELVRAAPVAEAESYLRFIPEWLRMMASDAQHVVDLNPHDWLAHWYHGLALRTTGETDFAMREFLTGLSLSQDFAADADRQIISERGLGILPDSVAVAESVLADHADNGQALVLLAVAKLGLKDNTAAADAAQKAIATASPAPQAFAVIGWTQIDLKRYDEAVVSFRRAVDGERGDVGAYMGLAQSLAAIHQAEAAIKAYKQAEHAALTPPHIAAARMGRARLLFALGNFSESLDAAVSAREAQPSCEIYSLIELARQSENNQFIRDLSDRLKSTQSLVLRATHPAAVKSLPLLNGDFELGLARYWGNASENGYVWQNHAGCESRAEISHDNPHAGSAALRIVSSTPRANGVYGTTSQTFPGEVTGRYRLALWAKAHDLSADALQLVINDRRDEPLITLPAGNYDWREFTGEFDIKKEAGRRVRGVTPTTVRILSTGPGEVSLDDLTVERIGDLEPEAAKN